MSIAKTIALAVTLLLAAMLAAAAIMEAYEEKTYGGDDK